MEQLPVTTTRFMDNNISKRSLSTTTPTTATNDLEHAHCALFGDSDAHDGTEEGDNGTMASLLGCEQNGTVAESARVRVDRLRWGVDGLVLVPGIRISGCRDLLLRRHRAGLQLDVCALSVRPKTQFQNLAVQPTLALCVVHRPHRRIETHPSAGGQDRRRGRPGVPRHDRG